MMMMMMVIKTTITVMHTDKPGHAAESVEM
jgi:hypothetical protein